MSDLKKNLMVKQPNVTELPENNGWPTPLVDESSPIRQVVNMGKVGEVSNKQLTSTSPESWEQGSGESPKTSQMSGSGHHTPES